MNMALLQNSRQVRSIINLMFYVATSDQAIWLTVYAIFRNANTDILMSLSPA